MRGQAHYLKGHLKGRKLITGTTFVIWFAIFTGTHSYMGYEKILKAISILRIGYSFPNSEPR